MQLQIRILFKILILPLCLAASFHNARANDRVALCQALAPSEPQELSESFKGKVEGKLSGVLSKLAGGLAELEGEYSRVSRDTLKDLPEAHKLYFWQRLIYLACVNRESGLNINDLAQAYLVGPSLLGSGTAINKSDIQVQLVGFDRVASIEAISHYEIPHFDRTRFPDLVFLFTNDSNQDINVYVSECGFVSFKFPEPIRISSFRKPVGNQTINMLTGTVRLSEVGPPSVRVPAGQKKYASYGIFQVNAPSFEERQTSKSACRYHVGDGTVFYPREVEVQSPEKYISQ